MTDISKAILKFGVKNKDFSALHNTVTGYLDGHPSSLLSLRYCTQTQFLQYCDYVSRLVNELLDSSRLLDKPLALLGDCQANQFAQRSLDFENLVKFVQMKGSIKFSQAASTEWGRVEDYILARLTLVYGWGEYNRCVMTSVWQQVYSSQQAGNIQVLFDDAIRTQS